MRPLFTSIFHVSPHRRFGVAVALLTAMLGAVSVPSAATALPAATDPAAPNLPHLKLTRAFPAPDTTVTAAPEGIRLWFSEEADLVATRITVTATNGVRIPLGKPARAPGRDMPIAAGFTTPLAPGRYTVAWKTMSKDGHVVSGTYAFTFATR